MAEFKTESNLQGLIYMEIFTVNIRSWKIHELVLAVTGIIIQLSFGFELVFFLCRLERNFKNKQKSSTVFEK